MLEKDLMNKRGMLLTDILIVIEGKKNVTVNIDMIDM